MNTALYNAVRSQDYSMPKENIERAVQRGGVRLGARPLSPSSMRATCPAGIAIIVEVLTDNRNRSAAEIRNIFSKHNGALGQPGAVRGSSSVTVPSSSMRRSTRGRCGGLRRPTPARDIVSHDGSSFEVLTDPTALAAVKAGLDAAGIECEQGRAHDGAQVDRGKLDEADARPHHQAHRRPRGHATM